MTRRYLGVLVLVASSTCASAPASAPREMPPTRERAPMAPQAPAMAATPFTAKQIRDACLPGRAITFVVEEPGVDPVQRRIRFIAADDERATMVTETIAEGSKVMGAPQTEVVTWEELRLHASFPAEKTVISDGTAVTPAGDFASKKYVITDGTKTTTLSFALDLPGPPVEMTIEREGRLVRSMVLLKNEPGGI
jgi:hypothetical protein